MDTLNSVSSLPSLQDYILLPLFTTSKSSNLGEALEILIKTAQTASGRVDLAAKSILPTVLQLCQALSYPSVCHHLLLSLKLLRNLCAGEISNQNSFIEQSGVEIISTLLSSVESTSDSDYQIIRIGLQVLGNVVLAGKEHQCAVWHRFFPNEFMKIVRVQRQETCDPLCMIIYTCCSGNCELLSELCGDQGLPLAVELVRTTSAVGFGEDWLKLLLLRICLEESHFPSLFHKLFPFGSSNNYEGIEFRDNLFVSEQAFLLSVLSEILNEQIREVTVSNDFALCVLGIFKKAVGVVDFLSRSKSALPTGSAGIDVLGFSLTILRDICAQDGVGGYKEDSVDVVDSLISAELLQVLLYLLRGLEPPSIVRKAIKHGETNEGMTSYSPKVCPYKGFRRDVVAVIGNCAYRRKHVQDEIREKNGILLLLQQCVTDEDNPFLREWGIWSVRNVLEGNAENQGLVTELELQGSVDVPEIDGLGLRVEVDEKTRRAKLVNVS